MAGRPGKENLKRIKSKAITKKIIVTVTKLDRPVFLKFTTPKANKTARPVRKTTQAVLKLIKKRVTSKVKMKTPKITLKNLLTKNNKGNSKTSKSEL